MQCDGVTVSLFRIIKTIAILLSLVVIGINIFFVYNTVDELEISEGLLAIVIIYGILYLVFCVYLGIHLAVSMGNQALSNMPLIQKYVMVTDSRLNVDI